MGNVETRQKIIDFLSSSSSHTIQALFIKADEKNTGVLSRHELRVFIEELLSEETNLASHGIDLDTLETSTYVYSLLLTKGVSELSWDDFVTFVKDDLTFLPRMPLLHLLLTPVADMAINAPELQHAGVRSAFNVCCNGKDYLTKSEASEFLRQLAELDDIGEARLVYADKEKAELVLGGYFSDLRRLYLLPICLPIFQKKCTGKTSW
jgi:hypothetical protein